MQVWYVAERVRYIARAVSILWTIIVKSVTASIYVLAGQLAFITKMFNRPRVRVRVKLKVMYLLSKNLIKTR